MNMKALKPTEPAAPVEHAFVVSQHGMEYIVQAEDFEIDAHGVYFTIHAHTDKATSIAFASHPCFVRQERPEVKA